ncbi:histidine phosphatase family protein [Altericroceibacterium spongiae]|uniref:Histidine phosphatase family protein n=1 Tax=Altericroceibacterium spongiae TaxID=2320269 RepID=A0A420EKV5_9SPHN|nr:histidine phosphatase family protein [Altericroceibacterium spongiae]RKF21280.1 histidine phosphatase family protein [Altericroceibacterium spongiae]
MKCLGLFRHAKSDWDDLALRDFDRGLNDRGKRGAALMGDHIRKHGIKWQTVIASPAARVKRTLESARLDMPVTWEERAYLADEQTLMDLLRGVRNNPDTLLLCGHNPGLQQLIFELVSPDAQGELCAIASDKYPTATFAVLELDIDDWADCTAGCGRLVHLARPRDLDPELGPLPHS